jgi:hypothetical protein
MTVDADALNTFINMCNCKKSLSQLNFQGDPGVGIANITSAYVSPTTTITILLTDGNSFSFEIEDPAAVDGENGQGINHISFTSSTGDPSTTPNQPGETDTYTVWGDVGETIELGTFTMFNPINATAINVGTGTADVYVTSSLEDYGTYRFRKLYSNTLEIEQETPQIRIDRIAPTWLEANPTGTPYDPDVDNVIFFNPGAGFTDVNHVATLGNVGMYKDLVTNQVQMKGVCKLTGSGSIGFAPTGSADLTSLVLLLIPTSLSPSVGHQRFTTAQLYNPTANHASTVMVNITLGAISIIVDSRLNLVDHNTFISFENTTYTL